MASISALKIFGNKGDYFASRHTSRGLEGRFLGCSLRNASVLKHSNFEMTDKEFIEKSNATSEILEQAVNTARKSRDARKAAYEERDEAPRERRERKPRDERQDTDDSGEGGRVFRKREGGGRDFRRDGENGGRFSRSEGNSRGDRRGFGREGFDNRRNFSRRDDDREGGNDRPMRRENFGRDNDGGRFGRRASFGRDDRKEGNMRERRNFGEGNNRGYDNRRSFNRRDGTEDNSERPMRRSYDREGGRNKPSYGDRDRKDRRYQGLAELESDSPEAAIEVEGQEEEAAKILGILQGKKGILKESQETEEIPAGTDEEAIQHLSDGAEEELPQQPRAQSLRKEKPKRAQPARSETQIATPTLDDAIKQRRDRVREKALLKLFNLSENSEAHDLFEMFMEEGARFNIKTFSLLFKTFSTPDGPAHERLEKYIDYMKSLNLTPDVTTYNSIISALIRQGRESRAHEFLNEMRKSKLKPDGVTYLVMLKTDSAKIPQLLEQMRAEGLQPGCEHYTSAIQSYSTGGDIDSMVSYLNEMKANNVQPDVVTYNCFIAYYSAQKDKENMLRYYQEMKNSQLKPNTYTLISLVELFSALGDTAAMMQAYEEIIKHRVRPPYSSLSLMIQTLHKHNDTANMAKYYEDLKDFKLEPRRPLKELMSSIGIN